MRKEITITLDDRGNPLTFKIREMSATHLESWLMRALLLLAGNVDMDGVQDMDKAGKFLLANGLKGLANVEYEKAQPLLDELLSCCSRVVDGMEQKCTPATVDGFIQDVKTLFNLRVEALKLNLDFFGQGQESPSSSPVKVGIGKPRKNTAA